MKTKELINKISKTVIEDINKIATYVNMLEDNNDTLKKKVGILESKVNELEGEKEELESKVDELEGEADNLEDEVSDFHESDMGKLKQALLLAPEMIDYSLDIKVMDWGQFDAVKDFIINLIKQENKK